MPWGGAIQSGGSRTEIHTAYGDLLRAVSAHFAHEERQMRHAGYDQTEAHKDDHERLLDALRDLMDAEPDQHAAEHLARVLGDWFAGHFSSHDARLHNRLGPHDHD